MISIDQLKIEFQRHSGIMKTSELNDIGLTSRQILKLTRENVISKIKTGVYEISESPASEEIIIARLFPSAVIYLESALLYYEYTDRIPGAWQIAVDKNISKPQFQITYPLVSPYFIDKKYMDIGIDYFQIDGVKIRIFDRDRTICDVLKYINKLDKEVVNNAIQRYIKDNKRNITKLMEYAEKLRVTAKVKMYIGVWL